MNSERQVSGTILAPVSAGELLDKISILRIKQRRIADPGKRALVEHELALLTELSDGRIPTSPDITRLCDELQQVNEALWDIEDAIRVKERKSAFDDEFITLARSVYQTNDRRAELKRELNLTLGSGIVEVKDYG